MSECTNINFGEIRIAELQRKNDDLEDIMSRYIQQKLRIAELESALIDAMEWNWLDDNAPERYDLNNLPTLEGEK